MRDQELDGFRSRVDCRTLLERAGWQFDKGESTANAAKFRTGAAIVIVTHQGRGWFDPLNDARGDVIALAQHVHGGTLGHARKLLRALAGLAPNMAETMTRTPSVLPLDASSGWRDAKSMVIQSQGWRYLHEERLIPPASIETAIRANVVREGIYGTVWFLHRGLDERPCGWEMRGPRYKGFSKGGDKALFWLGDIHAATRIAVTEAAIDALSLANLEGWNQSTAYVSTGGGFGVLTSHVLKAFIRPDARLVAATDRGEGGEILADRLHGIAAQTERGFSRLRPEAEDWNAQLPRP
jgi:hypothetical protein